MSRELTSSSTGETVASYVPFENWADDAAAAQFKSEPRFFIGDGWVFVIDSDELLLGEEILVAVLPD